MTKEDKSFIIKMMEKITILGIKIDNIDRNGVVGEIDRLLNGGQHLVFTPNPEIILEASKDEELFYILNQADLSLPDGFGLKVAAFLCGKKIARVSGSDVVVDLLQKCEKSLIPVGFVIWENGLSTKQDVVDGVSRKYPKLEFKVQVGGRSNNFEPNEEFLSINPGVVFFALGCPWQEKNAYHSISKIGSAKVLMGVGGAIDFISDKVRRAPKFMRYCGLEWLWRLILNPGRVKRIFNAVVVFTWRVLESRFIQPFLYRSCVSCLLYKRNSSGKYDILVVERQGELGHWQLPQGGTDGEEILKAGERELREELNTDRIIPKRVFKHLYRYKFGVGVGIKKNEKNGRNRHMGYKGQRLGLFIGEFVGCDEDIKVNFWDHSAWKWVDSEDLVNQVHLVRRRSAEIFLKKFKEFVKKK